MKNNQHKNFSRCQQSQPANYWPISNDITVNGKFDINVAGRDIIVTCRELKDIVLI